MFPVFISAEKPNPEQKGNFVCYFMKMTPLFEKVFKLNPDKIYQKVTVDCSSWIKTEQAIINGI